MTQSAAPPEPEVPRPPRRMVWVRLGLPLLAAALLLVVVVLRGRESERAIEASADAGSGREEPGGELTIEGMVRDDLDQPLAGAQVSVVSLERPEAAPEEARSDVNGRFFVRDLPREPLLISVAREGHEADERTLRPGDPTLLTFVLMRQGELLVLLRDQPGRVLEGADVVISGPELWPPRSQPASARGEVLFQGLAAGTYSVRARRGDRIAPPSPFRIIVPGERGREELSLTHGERLRGTVIDGDSKRALAGAKLAVHDLTPGMAPIEAITDSSGNFEIDGLWPVVVRVEVSRDGYAKDYEELKLPRTAALTFALRGAVSIAGRVRDERGKPIAHAALSLATQGERPLDLTPGEGRALDGGIGELGVTSGEIPAIPLSRAGEGWGVGTLAAYTDGEGKFRIDGLPPVPLLVSASARGYSSARLELRDLAPHRDRTDLEITLQAAGNVAGRLVDARGEPVGNVLVSARASGAEYASTTDARGEFAFVDVLGEVSISATPAGYVAPQCTVTVLAGATARCELRIDSPLFTLPVRVVDEYGFALEGAEVTANFEVSDAKGAQARRSVTRLSGSDGTAAVGELPRPPYLLEVALPGYVTVRDFAVASVEREVRVSLRRAASLRGTVLDALGRPVASAVIAGGPEPASSEKDGSFLVVGVAPGALTLSATHPRAGSGSSSEVRARPSEQLAGIRIVLSGRYDALLDGRAEDAADGGGPDAARATPSDEAPRDDGGADQPAESAPSDRTFAQRGRSVVVARVSEGSPAARAGLEESDEVVAIDGEAPLSAAHARGLLRDPAGKVANVRVLRNGKPVTLRYRRPPL